MNIEFGAELPLYTVGSFLGILFSIALLPLLLPRLWHRYFPMISAFWALSFAVPFVWSAVETALEWRRSRRRVALGLVDRQVSHRFLLWCVATSAFVAICLLHSVIAWLGADGRRQALRAARALRSAGLSAIFEFRDRRLGNQLKSADQLDARRAVIIGPQEIEAGQARIRDMSTGEERVVPFDELGPTLAAELGDG